MILASKAGSRVVIDERGERISLDWFEEGVCIEAARSVEFRENHDGHRFSLRGACDCCGPFIVVLEEMSHAAIA